MNHRVGIYLAAMLGMGVQVASAQAESPAELPATVVVGLRNPLEYPYTRAYQAAKVVQEASDGQIQLVIKLVDKSKTLDPALQIVLAYENVVEPIPLDETSSFVLVPNDAAIAGNGVFMVNRTAHSVGLQVDIRPIQYKEAVTVRELNQVAPAGRRVRAALLPWYARLITPTLNQVRMCAPSNGADFVLQSEVGKRQVIASFVSENIWGHTANCVDFPANKAFDAAGPDETLQLPSGTTFDFTGSMF